MSPYRGSIDAWRGQHLRDRTGSPDAAELADLARERAVIERKERVEHERRLITGEATAPDPVTWTHSEDVVLGWSNHPVRTADGIEYVTLEACPTCSAREGEQLPAAREQVPA